MSASDWIVILASLAAIAWVNWWFFLARRPAATAVAGAGGAQEVTITVQAGYAPAEVRVKRGVPVRLTFDRQETSGCSEEIVIPDFGTVEGPFQIVSFELTGRHDGEVAFDLALESAGALAFAAA